MERMWSVHTISESGDGDGKSGIRSYKIVESCGQQIKLALLQNQFEDIKRYINRIMRQKYVYKADMITLKRFFCRLVEFIEKHRYSDEILKYISNLKNRVTRLTNQCERIQDIDKLNIFYLEFNNFYSDNFQKF